MKTQLLEDIGQSATLSLVPSARVSISGPHKVGPDVAQTRAAMPAKPRPAFGVWRKKPDGEPAVLAIPQPDQPPPPLESPAALEPIAVAEAQYMPPEPVREEAIPRTEPTLAANAPHSEPAPHGPEFDFTLPLPATAASEPFQRGPGWFERSGRRYLLWGACVLSGALLIQGARIYSVRKDAHALAPLAGESKAKPQAGKAGRHRPKEFTLGPDGVVPTSAAPALSPPGRPPVVASPVPPLVLLEPERTTATKAAPTLAPVPVQKKPQAKPKPEHVAQVEPVVPLPKAKHRTAREQLALPAKPARAKVERASVRQLAHEPVMQAETKAEPESAMSAMLKACREHGYHAEQCVKRACSVTKYGFVCRGGTSSPSGSAK